MRFLMIGISIVIGIILVGVVFSVTMDLTQPREVEKVVEFEILYIDNDVGEVTVGTYEKFSQYGTPFDELVIVDILINGVSLGNPIDGTIYYDVGNIFMDDGIIGNGTFIRIYDNDNYTQSDYQFNGGDTVKVVFIVEEPQISSTSAILIALVPLLFATGVILYTYNTTLRGREE